MAMGMVMVIGDGNGDGDAKRNTYCRTHSGLAKRHIVALIILLTPTYNNWDSNIKCMVKCGVTI